jgi:hypothetical protein
MSLLVLLNIIALFVIGFLQDILGAYYLRLVNEQRYIFATFISFIHSLVGWGVWVWFMYQFQNSETMTGMQAVIYSVGGAFGTFLGLRKPGSHPAKISS